MTTAKWELILVPADAFSGGPDAFPCQTKQAEQVGKVLLEEIIPRYRIPVSSKWPGILPPALLRVGVTPRSKDKLSPFEIYAGDFTR